MEILSTRKEYTDLCSQVGRAGQVAPMGRFCQCFPEAQSTRGIQVALADPAVRQNL